MARRSRGGLGVFGAGRRGLPLPWEQRGVGLRELFSGQRWRTGLAIVLALMALFAVWRSAEARQQRRQTRAVLVEVQRALAAFRADLGRCPQSVYELVHPPRSGRRYLRDIPVDGWGRALRVQCPGRYDPDGADVVSAGPSGDFFVDDNLQ
jgi:type II secretory pathway pseudopilin PulG